MAFWDIFTGDKGIDTANKVLDAGISGLDKIFYTDEEKAEAHAKMGEHWLKVQEALATESSPRSVSRRIIAWSVVANVLLAFDVCLVLALTSRKEAIQSVVELVIAFNLGWAFVAIIIFYFGPHALSALQGKK